MNRAWLPLLAALAGAACAAVPQSGPGVRVLLESARCAPQSESFAARWSDGPAAWQDWRGGRGGTLGGSGPSEPAAVDFASERVLVLSAGTRPTPGYTLRLADSRRLGPHSLRLDLVEQRPEPGRMQAQVLTHPCLALALDATVDSVEVHLDQTIRRIRR